MHCTLTLSRPSLAVASHDSPSSFERIPGVGELFLALLGNQVAHRRLDGVGRHLVDRLPRLRVTAVRRLGTAVRRLSMSSTIDSTVSLVVVRTGGETECDHRDGSQTQLVRVMHAALLPRRRRFAYRPRSFTGPIAVTDPGDGVRASSRPMRKGAI